MIHLLGFFFSHFLHLIPPGTGRLSWNVASEIPGHHRWTAGTKNDQSHNPGARKKKWIGQNFTNSLKSKVFFSLVSDPKSTCVSEVLKWNFRFRIASMTEC